MRFTIAAILILTAATAFLLEIEWLFLTMAIFAVVALIAESSSSQTMPREFREERRQAARQNQQVVVMHPSGGAREFYNELITQITTGILQGGDINQQIQQTESALGSQLKGIGKEVSDIEKSLEKKK